MLPIEFSPRAVTNLFPSRTVTAASAFKHGSVYGVELVFPDGSSTFIKVGRGSALEIGGTVEMGTGSEVAW